MFDKRDLKRRRKIEAMRNKFKKGQVLGREDFKAEGFSDIGTQNALLELKGKYAMDLLTVYRGKILIGWILASEVL